MQREMTQSGTTIISWNSKWYDHAFLEFLHKSVVTSADRVTLDLGTIEVSSTSKTSVKRPTYY